jgi:GNAT superfamily N-acetyltransferase
MGVPGCAVEAVDEGNVEPAVRFLTEWVSDSEAEARGYLADHAEPEGASLVAACDHDVVGYAAIVWESNFAGFRDRGIPLVHQLAVAGPFRRQGVATLLMDAAEQLARDRGIATLGITVGLFDEYGPAQRLYGRRGYVPDGRGACQGQVPLRTGMQVTMDHDLIMWLTKELVTERQEVLCTRGQRPSFPADGRVLVVNVRQATDQDWPPIYPFYAAIMSEGKVAVGEGVIVGSAKMGPNRPGRGSHVATAAFLVDPACQDQPRLDQPGLVGLAVMYRPL